MGITSGNNQNLHILETGYQASSKDVALAAFSARQILVHSVTAYNASVSTINVGVGVRFSSDGVKFYDQAGLLFGSSSGTVFGTVANNGIIVQAKCKFGLVTFVVSQASAGSPVYVYQYWNGSTWTTLTTIASPSYSTLGEKTLVFAPPVDWAIGNGGLTADFSNAQQGYSIRILATTAPSTAVLASSITAAKMWAIRSVPATNHLEVDFQDRPMLLEANESIQPYFQTAGSLNTVEISYQVQQ